jgi:hypothetical protein
MRTSAQRYGLVVYPFIFLQSLHVAAKGHAGLLHEVTNITQAIALPQAVEATITSSATANFTTTETFTTIQQCLIPTSTPTIYSIIFPSPDASPIEVTTQSQVLTSYLPEMTWCVAPAVGFSALPLAPYSNATTTNYTMIMEGTGSCNTMYMPIETTVCATTLTGLASKVTVTDCDQEVTFSTECGFTLETPTPIISNSSLITPAPIIKRTFTYWIAPWQSLTAGETPSDIDVKICTELDDGNKECSRYQEVWEVVMVTRTTTTSRSINLLATVTGPGTLIIETIHAFINDTISTVDLSTTLLLEAQIETESTSRGRKSPPGSDLPTQLLTSTRFVTKTVVHKPARYVSLHLDDR